MSSGVEFEVDRALRRGDYCSIHPSALWSLCEI